MPGSPAETDRKSLFLRACRAEPVDRVPVWMMRQAGRYLPEYRAVRAKHSFLEVCKTPELAVEVSLQPYRLLAMDAVIVFSDILVPAEAMGLTVEFGDAGPVLPRQVRERSDVEALRDFDPQRDTAFVGEAINQLCRTLGPGVPVIGFAAAPWTLACYMIAGKSGSGADRAKRMMYADPALLRALLDKIARNTASYLASQISAGAAAVQLFDTWAGELSRADYREFALPPIQCLLDELRPGVTPVIYYSKASSHLLELLADTGADVLSVDWRLDLAQVKLALAARRGKTVAVQGNIDPTVLLGPPGTIRESVREAVSKTGGIGHILNLGHGILPETPVENARVFIESGQSAELPARAVPAV
jgi:uroporphyrinogen decarboxylase